MLKISRIKAKLNAKYILKKGIDPRTHKKLRFYCHYCDTEYIQHTIEYITFSKHDTICYPCYGLEKRTTYYIRLYEQINDAYLRKKQHVDDKIILDSIRRAEWFDEDFYKQHFLN